MTQRSSRKTPPHGARHTKPKAKSRFGWAFWLRLTACVLIIGTLGVGAVVIGLARDLPDTSALVAAPRTASYTLLDRQGRMITQRGQGIGEPLTADTLPRRLADAVIAVEDRRFYSHFGIDLIGMARAAFINMRAGYVVQGGSTITQQLAKNLFLSSERTYKRKAQEVLLALWLEQRFSKDEILALYLNRVYFGAGSYGADAAARRYFGHGARDLSIGEAALLAGLLKAPSRYSPATDAHRAAVRATVVLDLMLDTGRISEAERLEAANTPIRVSRGASSPGAGWFADWITSQVREEVGTQTQDLIIYTTLDVDAQRAAEYAMSSVLNEGDLARGAEEGALVALDTTGGVLALVGGRDYATSPYNRAVSAHRQPGSAFKAFVYASAFEGGLYPEDIYVDSPVSFGTYTPQNYNDRYEGLMNLETAFAKSSNSIAVQVAESIGRANVLRTAQRLGIESRLENTHALSLGAYEVTPMEMASAYAPFMNGGLRTPAYAITRIETLEGRVLYERPATDRVEVLAPRVQRDMRRLFGAVVDHGTGRGARVEGRSVFGKTGTTNDNRDAWFAGWADGIVASVWMGNDDGSSTDHGVGGAGPARAFSRFMAYAPIYPGIEAEAEPIRQAPSRLEDLLTGAISTREEDAEPGPEPREDESQNDPIGSLLQSLGG